MVLLLDQIYQKDHRDFSNNSLSSLKKIPFRNRCPKLNNFKFTEMLVGVIVILRIALERRSR